MPRRPAPLLRSRRPLALLAGLIPLVACSGPPSAPRQLPRAQTFDYVHPETNLSFPAQLGSYRRVRIRSDPDPGVGTGITYTGWGQAEVFVYDMGYDAIPTGVDSTPFRQAFAHATSSLWNRTNSPPFRNGSVVLQSEPIVRMEDRIAKLRVAMFSYTRVGEDGREDEMSTWLLMTAYKDHFLKLLFTHPGSDPAEPQEALRELILAFLEANAGETRHFFVEKTR